MIEVTIYPIRTKDIVSGRHYVDSWQCSVNGRREEKYYETRKLASAAMLERFPGMKLRRRPDGSYYGQVKP